MSAEKDDACRTEPPARRPVRSFVRRAGRLTRGQARALEELWPRYGIDVEDLPRAAWPQRFPPAVDPARLTLEIGFGMGEALAEIAAADPERPFVGIEVHPPGVGALLRRLDESGAENVRVLAADVAEVLEDAFAPATLDRVQIFFPDPWPKKRHHKRRLIQPTFVERLASRVRAGGHLVLATDWEPYAEWMLEVLAGSPAWRNTAADFAPRPDFRPPTRFEQRGLDRGHRVRDLVFERI